jgi:nitrogen regulatory protein PII
MLVDDHANAGSVEVEVTAERAGLADKVGTALAQDGVEAVTPTEIAGLGRSGTMPSWREHAAIDVQLIGV